MCGYGFIVYHPETLQALLLHIFLNQGKSFFLATTTPLIIRIITIFLNTVLSFLLNMSIMLISFL